jgi:ADP-ribose pyrophosphatase YjhB (NUDIX family)
VASSGGGVDDGESVEEALRREMREETGCELADIEAVASYEVDERTEDFRALVHLFARRPSAIRARAGVRGALVIPADSGYHPALRRELADAGLRAEDDEALGRALTQTNLTMRRVR